MRARDDLARYLAAIDALARRGGAARIDDVARATGLTFARASAVVSRLHRDHLVRHLPRSGIFVTERGRSALLHAD